MNKFLRACRKILFAFFLVNGLAALGFVFLENWVWTDYNESRNIVGNSFEIFTLISGTMLVAVGVTFGPIRKEE